jgi:hypothetical protein
MPYARPSNPKQLSKAEKVSLLQEYAEHYREAYANDPQVLSRKLPKRAFAPLLDRLGQVLLEESAQMATAPGDVRDFLASNPLPSSLAPLLPDSFRAFCLALNAVKQWVAAEQAAADRYLLGGRARELCREASTRCLVTGNSVGAGSELHHPVRDGRPPLLLSKTGHATVEQQLPGHS